MFTKPKIEEDPVLTELRNYIRKHLTEETTTPDEFNKTLDQYTKLLTIESANKRDRRVSADTLAMVAANIGGIVLIIGHERANVIASKALSFVSKLK